MLTVCHYGRFPIVYHDATRAERLRMISNGYTPFERELERNETVYRYARGETKPHYPVPAIDNPCHRDYARGDLTLLGFFVAL